MHLQRRPSRLLGLCSERPEVGETLIEMNHQRRVGPILKLVCRYPISVTCFALECQRKSHYAFLRI